VGVAVAFTVSASGTPAATLALQSQTASSGYSFTPATGAFTYTPPAGDVGTPTFTFTAANAAGTVTQVTSVVVSAVPTAPAAPAAIWASATNATGFTAAWSSASGATSYRLDVATNETFSGGGGGGATVTSLVISNNTAARPAINNLVWTDYGAGAPSFVPGYENRTVSGTSESVTGLVENTTYYFRVRAVNDIGSSGDSATGSVTTLEASAPGTPPTVDAIPAQIANVGVEFEYAVTATEPDADAVTFACTSAVDGGTWDFDENTGDFLFLPTVAQLGTNYFSFTATDKDGTSDPVQMGVKVYSAAASNEFTQWIEDREQDPVDPEFAPDGDADLDGTSNYDEFLADTDPANSNSVLKLEGDYYIASQVGEATGQIEFSFPASPNRFYQLEYCTDLTNHVTGVGFSGWGTPGPDGRMTITNNAVGTWYGVIRVRLNEP
jgi:hypothetical protein